MHLAHGQKPAIEKAEAERQRNGLDLIRDDSDLDRSTPAYVFKDAALPITVSDGAPTGSGAHKSQLGSNNEPAMLPEGLQSDSEDERLSWPTRRVKAPSA